MKRLIWLLALVAGVLWSLFAWGAYALVAWLGDVVSSNAHWVTDHAEALAWLSWGTGLLTSLGLAGVIVVWLVGMGLVALVPPVLLLIAGRARRRDAYDPSMAPPSRQPDTWRSPRRRGTVDGTDRTPVPWDGRPMIHRR